MQLLDWIGFSYTDLIERDCRSCADLLWTQDVLNMRIGHAHSSVCVCVRALLHWLPSIIEPIGICCIINPKRDSRAGVKNIPRTTINKIFIRFSSFPRSFIHSFAFPWQAQHLWFIQYICRTGINTHTHRVWLVYKVLWKHKPHRHKSPQIFGPEKSSVLSWEF